MKKIFQILLISAFMVGLNTIETFGQRTQGESVLSAGVGMNFLSIQLSITAAGEGYESSSTPTFNVAYDYGLTDNFSIGAAVGYNSFSVTDNNYSYYDPNGNLINDKVEFKASRLNIGIRPLYHWGRKDELDWHTGIRLGYSKWDTSVESSDPQYENEYNTESLYSFQVLFGARAYFSDYVGMTFDLAIGTPYFASIGMCVRL